MRMFRQFLAKLTSLICEKFHKLTEVLYLLRFFGVEIVRIGVRKSFLGKNAQ